MAIISTLLSFLAKKTGTIIQARSRASVVLSLACARAGLVRTVEEPTARMMLATTVLKKLAKAMVSPSVAEEIKVVRAKDLEMYLYPADLLLRGKEQPVATGSRSETSPWRTER